MTVIKDPRLKGLRTLLQTDGAHVETSQIQIDTEKKPATKKWPHFNSS